MSETIPSATECPRYDGMPALGLGTWENTDPEECAESVASALDMGYRHVDTAVAYDNEEAVGNGLDRASVDRDEVFLATKIWIDSLAYEDVIESARESRERLGVEYVDLLYIHWPARTYDPEETLAAFAELREEGFVEHIGASNFEPGQLDEAREVVDAPIFANQVEMHPLLPQEELREYCDRYDIELVAYSPLARGEVFGVPEIADVAEKHGVSAAQVSLAWLREKGVTAIPKARGVHIRDNWRSLSIDLDPGDVERIDSIDRTERKVDPSFAPW